MTLKEYRQQRDDYWHSQCIIRGPRGEDFYSEVVDADVQAAEAAGIKWDVEQSIDLSLQYDSTTGEITPEGALLA